MGEEIRSSSFFSSPSLVDNNNKSHSNGHVASDILSRVLQDADAHLGGSSIGKGLTKAANYYLKQKSKEICSDFSTSLLSLPGANDLKCCREDIVLKSHFPTEDAFYVVDVGVVISQVYQCTCPSGIISI